MAKHLLLRPILTKSTSCNACIQTRCKTDFMHFKLQNVLVRRRLLEISHDWVAKSQPSVAGFADFGVRLSLTGGWGTRKKCGTWLPVAGKKGSPYSITSVWFRSWSRFLAVSIQLTWVINSAIGCHYFPPGLQLPSRPLRRLLPVLLLGEQRHDGCEQFA